MRDTHWGVIAPLLVEARCLVGDSRPAEVRRVQGYTLSVCGMGAVRARQAAQGLIDAGVAGLISFGTAGGLSASLKGGQLCVSAEFVHPKAGLLSDALALRLAQGWSHELDASLVRLATVDQPVGTPDERRDLANRTGAAAVDLETHPIALLAVRAGLPCIALRVILDDLAVTLPSGLGAGVDDFGRPRLRLLAWLLANPRRLGALVGLARQLRRSQATLRAVGLRLPGLLAATEPASGVSA